MDPRLNSPSQLARLRRDLRNFRADTSDDGTVR